MNMDRQTGLLMYDQVQEQLLKSSAYALDYSLHVKYSI